MDNFIPVYQPDLSGNELEYVTDCVTSGWISSLGDYVVRFEDKFAEYCGVNHGVALANGTVSLHLALLLRDIGYGDEVIVPTLTFIASANAVAYTGATPVFVDSDPHTWTIDPKLIEEKISERTKSIIPVHLYGHPANMEPILTLAEKFDLFVIEDAAEAHGAEFLGRRVGGIGHSGVFSFYGNKVITTGEGGMITTNDPELAEKARFLKDHAMSKEIRYFHPEVGFNYRMTNIQAAIGLAQLERIDTILVRKREIAQLYHEYLKDCEGVILQPEAAWAKNVYWMYSILITNTSLLDRGSLMRRLRKRGVDSRPFFIPMHKLPPFREEDGDYPIAEELSKRGINLPSYPTLTNHEIEYICKMIKELTMK